MMSAYQEIEKRYQQIRLFGSVLEVLDWDRDVNMPDGGAELRGEQQAMLQSLRQDIFLLPDWEELFEKASHDSSISDWQKANLREAKRIWVHEASLSSEFVAEIIRTITLSTKAWEKAKATNDFALWQPHFEKVIELSKKKAEIKSKMLGLAPYDALIDEFQPGLSSAEIDTVFAELKEKLPPLIQKIRNSQKTPFEFSAEYSKEKQDILNKLIMQTIGLDLNHSRIDVSVHPFNCGMGVDTRLTYTPGQAPLEMSRAVMHESGHALYEQSLPRDWMYQPVGQSLGMAAHESQSLFWEQQIFFTEEFLGFLTAKMKEVFGHSEITQENILSVARKVEPSFIRIHADEVTYPLHIIFRYEIERDLINGTLEVRDVPARWNEKMQEYLGITPETDSQGCLQDVHWGSGLIGYFPSYAIGSITAAQLVNSMEKAQTSVLNEVASGNLSGAKKWLNENFHNNASFYPFSELVQKITGEKLTAKHFLARLEKRYLA